MATPKLLLQLRGRRLIEIVLEAWIASRVDHVAVVVKENDAQLADYCRRAGVDVVLPARDPDDMRASIACGLAHLVRHYSPRDNDAWLVAPADLPGLTKDVINSLLENYRPHMPMAVTPVVEGKRAHPVLFPWRLAAEVSQLPPDAGVNRLVRDAAERGELQEVVWHDSHVLRDVDTPEDYRAVLNAGLGGR